jgi:hypothetical protein
MSGLQELLSGGFPNLTKQCRYTRRCKKKKDCTAIWLYFMATIPRNKKFSIFSDEDLKKNPVNTKRQRMTTL